MTRETSVQQRASLHEKTVQAVANGTAAPVPTKTRKARQKAILNAYNITVDPQVLAVAKRLMVGTYSRLEIVSATEVVVR